jgi:hypothetical protein
VAVVAFENPHVLLLAASRFRADNPGFGMTKGRFIFRKQHAYPRLAAIGMHGVLRDITAQG